MSREQTGTLEEYLVGRFGIQAETFESYVWAKRAETPAIWLVGKDALWDTERSWETLGIPAFRKAPPEGYPTNLFMRTFASHAHRGVCELACWDESCRFMAGETLVPATPPSERGFCFVRFGDVGLGRGEWTGAELLCRIPKAFRTPLKQRKGDLQ